MGIGPAELIVIFIVALIVFGPRKLPEIGRSIGRGISELRKAAEGYIYGSGSENAIYEQVDREKENKPD